MLIASTEAAVGVGPGTGFWLLLSPLQRRPRGRDHLADPHVAGAAPDHQQVRDGRPGRHRGDGADALWHRREDTTGDRPQRVLGRV
jgi:hypothetical protein